MAAYKFRANFWQMLWKTATIHKPKSNSSEFNSVTTIIIIIIPLSQPPVLLHSSPLHQHHASWPAPVFKLQPLTDSVPHRPRRYTRPVSGVVLLACSWPAFQACFPRFPACRLCPTTNYWTVYLLPTLLVGLIYFARLLVNWPASFPNIEIV